MATSRSPPAIRKTERFPRTGFAIGPTMQPAPQDIQLMSKHRVLSLKPQLRLEWRGQDGQNETEQPDHSASLGDSITASTQIRFSVHTRATAIQRSWPLWWSRRVSSR